ncbi:hypothetical protein CW304_17700 [Bacillus sp. UFRGS-B20]|nr:hypothetical protein CW304_17700 [Bacillus sp. UFRGS-B20]
MKETRNTVIIVTISPHFFFLIYISIFVSAFKIFHLFLYFHKALFVLRCFYSHIYRKLMFMGHFLCLATFL